MKTDITIILGGVVVYIVLLFVFVKVMAVPS